MQQYDPRRQVNQRGRARVSGHTIMDAARKLSYPLPVADDAWGHVGSIILGRLWPEAHPRSQSAVWISLACSRLLSHTTHTQIHFLPRARPPPRAPSAQLQRHVQVARPQWRARCHLLQRKLVACRRRLPDATLGVYIRNHHQPCPVGRRHLRLQYTT